MLALTQGVTLQIDDGTAGAPLPFRTCLPGGCLVSLSLDAKTIAALRKATAIKLKAVADGGQAASFSVSLKGFAGAFDRTVALAQ
ncbi:MAG TPA: invasion associated locus B family protein [Arsenicitalea sp.]|nr:invasion associated locus B family protein [Arsenicitalea sp.]